MEILNKKTINNKQNTVATPLAAVAIKQHNYIFNRLYPCPLQVKIENGKAAIKVDYIFQSKYLPFILLFVLVTSILTPLSCLFLLTLKLFLSNTTQLGVVQLVIIIFVGSCTFCQLGVVVLYYKSSEIEGVVNQIFLLEQKRKTFEILFAI